MAKESAHVSVTEAAKELEVSDRQVRNLIAGGKLPAEQVGRAHIIKRTDLAKFPRARKPGRPRKAK
jgi:excisionase family DNA binding protein